MKKIRILLIEDDRVDQMAFKRLVKEKDLPYDYTVAGSVREAKDSLSAKKFDIVIVDYLLGEETAFDIFPLVKKMSIILVTGAGNEEVAVKAMKEGAYDYLIKDTQGNYLNVLPITVENALKHRQTENQFRILSQAITSTKDSVYITDTDNKIIFVNQAFCETYGYDQGDILGREPSSLSGRVCGRGSRGNGQSY
ncbi:response regulator [bacterium]|nr:response regulator [bacterium]